MQRERDGLRVRLFNPRSEARTARFRVGEAWGEAALGAYEFKTFAIDDTDNAIRETSVLPNGG